MHATEDEDEPRRGAFLTRGNVIDSAVEKENISREGVLYHTPEHQEEAAISEERKFQRNILNSFEKRESLGKISRKKLSVRHTHVGSAGISEFVDMVLLPAADDTVFECPIEAWDDPGHQPPEREAGIWFQ